MSPAPRGRSAPPILAVPAGASVVAARDAGPTWAYELWVAAAGAAAVLPALVGGLGDGASLAVPDATSRDPEGMLTVRRTRHGFSLRRGGHGWGADAVAADLAGALAAVAAAAARGTTEGGTTGGGVAVYLDHPKLAPGAHGA